MCASKQDVHESINMARQTCLYLYLPVCMFIVIMSKGSGLGDTDGSEGEVHFSQIDSGYE